MEAAVARSAAGCGFGPACDCGLHGYVVSLRRSAHSATEGYWVEADSADGAESKALAMSGATSGQVLALRPVQ